MRKLINKIIGIIVLIALFFSINNGVTAQSKSINVVYKIELAKDDDLASGGGYNSRMGDLISDSWKDETDASDKVTNVITTIVVVVKIVAVAIAIIMLLVIAIKYMTSAPSDKAEIKKHAVVYIVGAVILFAVTGILSVIQQFATVFDSPSTQQ